MTQEIGVANHVLDGQTAMGLAGLDGRVELLEKQGRFLLDQQEQESNTWHNVAFNLREEVLEGEGKIACLQDLLDVQRKSSQQLCLSFNEAPLGERGPLTGGYMLITLWFFKQFIHTFPRGDLLITF